MDFDDEQMHFFIRRIFSRHHGNRSGNNSDSDNNINSDDSSVPEIHTGNEDTDDDDEDVSNLRTLACGTQ